MISWATGEENTDFFLPTSPFCLDGKITDFSHSIVAGGGYSNIWTGQLNGSVVAIKVIREFALSSRENKSKLSRRVCREYLTWSSLSHQNIVPFLGFSRDFTQDSEYQIPALICPWMENGTLLDYIESNPDTNRLPLISGVADGLYYLHQQMIIHGDLRAGNILISDKGVPHLSDFGLSRILRESFGLTTSSEAGGALRWMAPELFHEKVTTASDVWAYGMTILEVTSGEPPFAEIRLVFEVYTVIKSGTKPARPRLARGLTDELWELCLSCWAYEPYYRPDMSRISKSLHAYPANIPR
ncbi:hypothetical protein M422DRAFT_156722 [Sphaerobolus stellatus SS14]|nr:hypothetical protein M422DRAFT_156722 [Sphaerobolus stellatus SS14]